MFKYRPFSLCWACWALGLAIALGLLLSGAAYAEVEHETVLMQIRSAELRPELAVEVSDLSIDLGLGTLDLEEGILIPAVEVAGRTFEMVFLGQAWFRITPPDALETAQLELFTDQDALATSVTQAILTVGSSDIVQQILARQRVDGVEPEQLAAATTAIEDWIASPERKGIGSDAAIFKAACGAIAGGVAAEDLPRNTRCWRSLRWKPGTRRSQHAPRRKPWSAAATSRRLGSTSSPGCPSTVSGVSAPAIR